MILPILAYGHRILRQRCETVNENCAAIDTLVADMWQTMYNANGCGLAAPQIGKALRIFIVDSKATYQGFSATERNEFFDASDQGIKETFINARITDRSADDWADEEGCLSIPGITQQITRPWAVTIEYLNAGFERHTRTFRGATARMIQHEYDHTEGILYTDHLSPLSRKLLDGKLKKVMRGQVAAKYPMKFI